MPRAKETSAELEPRPKHSIIALEGLGGGGKTHVGNRVKEFLSASGQPAEIFKFAGLGEELIWLKEIRRFREQIYRDNQETAKQRRDRELDRIYYLASVKQSKKIAKAISGLSAQTVIILDRTPFVGFAYAQAQNPDNPFLETIYTNNLQVARMVGMQGVILLDLSAEESYARTFARYYLHESKPESLINEAIKRIQAPPAAGELIRQRTLELINSGIIKPKEAEAWHFPPFEFTRIHRETFKEGLQRGHQDLGFELIMVNADQPLEAVINDTLLGINKIRTAEYSFQQA